MANIDIEKFIADCIRKAERSVTWDMISENVDGGIFKAALREQGLKWDGQKIVPFEPADDTAPAEPAQPVQPTKRYYVVDKETGKGIVTSEEPPMKNRYDRLLNTTDGGQIRLSDCTSLIMEKANSIIRNNGIDPDSFWSKKDIADLERECALSSKKIKETMETHPFFEHARKAGYQKGVSDMWWQVKHDAKECVVQTNSMSGNTVVVHLDWHYKAGDKVKVLVIKED